MSAACIICADRGHLFIIIMIRLHDSEMLFALHVCRRPLESQGGLVGDNYRVAKKISHCRIVNTSHWVVLKTVQRD